MSLNIEELKKAMYPDIMLSENESLAYDYKIGITTKENITFCYMMYYLADDSYNFKFFRSLEELNKWEYNALYIFRITCEERHFEEIDESGYFKEMVSIIHSFRDNLQR